MFMFGHLETCLLFLIFFNTGMNKATEGTRSEVALINFLFQNEDKYSNDALPNLPGKPVNLTIDIALRQLLVLDEKIEIMEINAWIRHYWRDEYLIWNPIEWGVDRLTVSPDKIWKPDLTLYNNAEKGIQGFDQYGKTRITISSNGEIVWLMPTILRSTCKLDMRFFPFDEQVCNLTFGSWAYDQSQIDLFPKNPTGSLDSYVINGEFILNRFVSVRESKKYSCCPNPFVTVTYRLFLQRKGNFYLYKIILPGVLISLLSCFSFILPPSTGERTGLVITNFLSLSVYVLIVSDSVPPSSDTLPLLVKFYTILMIEIGLALLTNCIIISLDAKSVPVPKWVCVLFLNNHKKNIFRIIKRKFLSKTTKVVETNKSNSFPKYNFEMSKGDKNKIKSGKREEVNFLQLNDTLAKKLKYTSNVAEENGVVSSNQNCKMKGKWSEINISELKSFYEFKKEDNDFNYLEKINEFLNIKIREKSIRQDWVKVAKSIDRLFFTLFAITILCSSVYIFSYAPNKVF
ncbi:neuronal acetylcholine receptor subunit alpha-9 isoform X2 [Hydra vulgaris]|uniref:Neuronal acetylcholine receptor subunit alpha-9 isoform X2 n=1 Tax=Hydra vulgaris TaxID=6087 RepID=A0ABM4C7K1_HYDVU